MQTFTLLLWFRYMYNTACHQGPATCLPVSPRSTGNSPEPGSGQILGAVSDAAVSALWLCLGNDNLLSLENVEEFHVTFLHVEHCAAISLADSLDPPAPELWAPGQYCGLS